MTRLSTVKDKTHELDGQTRKQIRDMQISVKVLVERKIQKLDALIDSLRFEGSYSGEKQYQFAYF